MDNKVLRTGWLKLTGLNPVLEARAQDQNVSSIGSMPQPLPDLHLPASPSSLPFEACMVMSKFLPLMRAQLVWIRPQFNLITSLKVLSVNTITF